MAHLEWTIITVDDTPLLGLKDPSHPGGMRLPTLAETERVIRLLNEEGSNVIRLSCTNPECKDKGGWIERTRKDVEKNVYQCDTCRKPMER